MSNGGVSLLLSKAEGSVKKYLRVPWLLSTSYLQSISLLTSSPEGLISYQLVQWCRVFSTDEPTVGLTFRQAVTAR